VCPGYRSQVDVIFRDQSDNVIRKAKASEAKKKTNAPPSDADPGLDDVSTESEQAPDSRKPIHFADLVDGGLTLRSTTEEVRELRPECFCCLSPYLRFDPFDPLLASLINSM
jgi:hypothetical protein